jgi:hypothetical protein
MTASKPSRALSTLSPVPDNLKTPDAMRTTAEIRGTREEGKKILKREVSRLLGKDRQALLEARRKAEKALSTAGLEPEMLEQKLADAALNKLTQRRLANQDISAVYPAFRDYVPPIVYGNDAWGDQERGELIERQLDMSGCARARVQRHEESDDEEPNPYLKKEEPGEERPAVGSALSGITREIRFTKREASAQRYSEAIEARTTSPRHSSEEYASDSEDSTDLESESESEDEEDLNVPLVAVLRGQPLPKDLPPPTPSKSKVRSKHRLATGANTAFQAVLRGQLPKSKQDPSEIGWVWVAKKGMVPRKRVRGGETGPPEIEDCSQEHKHKKAKVEAKDTGCAFQAVSRGQIAKKRNNAEIEWVWVAKKGMVPRK